MPSIFLIAVVLFSSQGKIRPKDNEMVLFSFFRDKTRPKNNQMVLFFSNLHVHIKRV